MTDCNVIDGPTSFSNLRFGYDDSIGIQTGPVLEDERKLEYRVELEKLAERVSSVKQRISKLALRRESPPPNHDSFLYIWKRHLFKKIFQTLRFIIIQHKKLNIETKQRAMRIYYATRNRRCNPRHNLIDDPGFGFGLMLDIVDP
ncbi:hypothetical protein J6590_096384 [Homalodisca vitripennis]|nr:hypothetical protein J6590_096384 [Homalodisca vitripennis]